MWVQLVIYAILSFLLLPILSRKKSSKYRKQRLSDTFPILDLWDVFLETILALTIKYRVPYYEFGEELAKRKGMTLQVRSPFTKRITIQTLELDLTKEILSSPSWSDRLPDNNYLFRASFNKPLGLLFGKGEYWKSAHQVFLKLQQNHQFFQHDKVQGFAQFEMEELQADLSRSIEACRGELVFSPHQMFDLATLNVIWKALVGERFDIGDQIGEDILDTFDKAKRDFSPTYTILEVLPFVRNLSRWRFLKSWKRASDLSYRLSREILTRKRERRVNLTDDPEDLVEGFLQEIDSRGGIDEYLSDENLLAVIRDVVYAGLDSTNSVLEHLLLHVALKPEIQAKVQAEIDQVIGPSRAPVYDDKVKMTYTEAVLLEAHRLGSPVPATSRIAEEETEIWGRTIPKGSLFYANIYALHRSEELWEQPELFRPERFVNKDGNMLSNTQKILPFGHGMRKCVGQHVAEAVVFIFFVTIMRKYTMKISLQHPPPSFKNRSGLSRCPRPYYLVIKKREGV